ncbi:ABC transporter substrate-binding protein [Beduinella massiliensis]|uniref:ABC transporter substrate-binding protein n=1 Tax=Beduinella massiliensis TaxID=1852363 RepID=UPI0031F91359
MKRLLSLVLTALLLALPVLPGLAEDEILNPLAGKEAAQPEALPDGAAQEEMTKLVVGSTTEMSGNFLGDIWGNNTADIDVRTLLHGYDVVAWTQEAMYTINPSVVLSATVVDDREGNRTYVMELRRGLMYNDSTPITARDYVFSLLLRGAPQIKAIGGETSGVSHILGYDDYANGTTPYFSGVRFLNNFSFSITIKAEYLPFFYELTMLSTVPYPISVIAPGCTVADDGNGAYVTNADAAVAEPVFTPELLKETLLAPETGYVSHPTVSSGPYRLTSYDEEARVAQFEINEYYLGNYEGQKPVIPELEYRQVSNEEAIGKLLSGEIGLLNKGTDSEVIAAGLEQFAQDALGSQNYPRSGLGFISFACEQGPAQFEAVRKAVAYALDRDAMTADFTGNYGQTVDGYYGFGQWMVQMVNGTLSHLAEGETETAAQTQAWDELSLEGLEHYTKDLEKAEALLVADGWTLNEKGEAFIKGTDAVRYKDVDGELMRLSLKWAKLPDNRAADLLEEALVQPLAAIGMEILAEEVPFSQLLRHYYRQDARTYDMFYMATNFVLVFDPYAIYNAGEDYNGALMNTTGYVDKNLQKLALDMRQTEVGDYLSYCKKWVAFQEYWNSVLPAVPLYSNVYFDFYTTKLQDYAATSNQTWADAILYAWLGDPVETPEDEITTDDIIILP